MPNWCSNFARIHHSNPAMIDKILKGNADPDGGILNELMPCPAELTDTMAGSYGKGQEEKQQALEAQEKSNIEKYGYKNWYDWQVANWGTKWDLCDVSLNQLDDNTVELHFETAWSPPIAAFENLVTNLGFDIEAMYYESGMVFAGKWSSDGTDEYYNDWGDSHGARATLPTDLDDMFTISESQAEYEEEEREEEELYKWVKDGKQAQGKKHDNDFTEA